MIKMPDDNIGDTNDEILGERKGEFIEIVEHTGQQIEKGHKDATNSVISVADSAHELPLSSQLIRGDWKAANSVWSQPKNLLDYMRENADQIANVAEKLTPMFEYPEDGWSPVEIRKNILLLNGALNNWSLGERLSHVFQAGFAGDYEAAMKSMWQGTTSSVRQQLTKLGIRDKEGLLTSPDSPIASGLQYAKGLLDFAFESLVIADKYTAEIARVEDYIKTAEASITKNADNIVDKLKLFNKHGEQPVLALVYGADHAKENERSVLDQIAHARNVSKDYSELQRAVTIQPLVATASLSMADALKSLYASRGLAESVAMGAHTLAVTEIADVFQLTTAVNEVLGNMLAGQSMSVVVDTYNRRVGDNQTFIAENSTYRPNENGNDTLGILNAHVVKGE